MIHLIILPAISGQIKSIACVKRMMQLEIGDSIKLGEKTYRVEQGGTEASLRRQPRGQTNGQVAIFHTGVASIYASLDIYDRLQEQTPSNQVGRTLIFVDCRQKQARLVATKIKAVSTKPLANKELSSVGILLETEVNAIRLETLEEYHRLIELALA
jgi:hypothetical protein